MTNELEPEVIDLVKQGRKIEAIKRLRELRGVGLREAKELIESYCSEHAMPDPGVQRVSSGGGLLFLILIIAAGYLVYWYVS